MRLSNEDYSALRESVESLCGPMEKWETDYFNLHATRYAETLSLLGPARPGAHLLDIGSFPGHMAVLSAKRGYRVFGINSDVENAESFARFRHQMDHAGVSIFQCNVEQDPFPFGDETIDVALCCELIEHLWSNPFHLLGEVFRVLKPDGVLVLTTPNLAWWENIVKLMRGITHHPRMSRPFYEVYSSILYHRHNREYTSDDLAYMLARQNKEPYRFHVEDVYFSPCYDPDRGEVWRDYSGREFLQSLCGLVAKQINPGWRSTLMVRARKPVNLRLLPVDGLEVIEGFCPVEEDLRDEQGFTKRVTIPFRRMKEKAVLRVPTPQGGKAWVFTMLIGCWPKVRSEWTILTISLNGRPIEFLGLGPSEGFIKIHIPVERTESWEEAEMVFRVFSHDGDGKSRMQCGDLLLGWGGIVVEEIGQGDAGGRSVDLYVQERKEPHHVASLKHVYFPKMGCALGGKEDPARTIRMGRNDQGQLLAGWYWRENWGKTGNVRWSGKEGTVWFIINGEKHLFLDCYSGEKGLGAVSGRLRLSVLEETGFRLIAEYPFRVESDRWEVIERDLPLEASGFIVLTVVMDETRNPSRLIEGSSDRRELGLAVRAIGIA